MRNGTLTLIKTLTKTRTRSKSSVLFYYRVLSSLPGTPEIHQVWRLEQNGDDETGSASAESLLDEGSDTAMQPVAGKKKTSKRRFTGTIILLFILAFSSFLLHLPSSLMLLKS